MLLDYLYENYLNEEQFAATIGKPVSELAGMIETGVFPAASYQYEINGQASSFISTFSHKQTYRFHLKGHFSWFKDVERLQFRREAQAKQHFAARFDSAKQLFFAGSLGSGIAKLVPEIVAAFDDAQKQTTWNHFRNGVYGVYTKDGSPEAIFVKLVLVRFIDFVTSKENLPMSDASFELLNEAVALLDMVESDFAPHELQNSSRQRCIKNVRSKPKEHWCA